MNVSWIPYQTYVGHYSDDDDDDDYDDDDDDDDCGDNLIMVGNFNLEPSHALLSDFIDSHN